MCCARPLHHSRQCNATQADFKFGYSLPLSSVAQRAPNGTYQLRLKFSPAIAGLVIKDLMLKVLPCIASAQRLAWQLIRNQHRTGTLIMSRHRKQPDAGPQYEAAGPESRQDESSLLELGGPKLLAVQADALGLLPG